jgi:hypothetical protein
VGGFGLRLAANQRGSGEVRSRSRAVSDLLVL